jgi:hypothetical protein
MKLPSALLGSLAAALAGLGMTGCDDSKQTSNTAPKAKTAEAKGSPLNLVNPDGCHVLEQQPQQPRQPHQPQQPGGRNPGDECPGCGRG